MARLNLREPIVKSNPLFFNDHILFYRWRIDKEIDTRTEFTRNIIQPKDKKSAPRLDISIYTVDNKKKDIFDQDYREVLGKPINIFFEDVVYSGIIEDVVYTSIRDGRKPVDTQDDTIFIDQRTEPFYTYNIEFLFNALSVTENEDYLRQIFDLGGEIIE